MDEKHFDDELAALRAHDPAGSIQAPEALRRRVADLSAPQVMDREPIPLEQARSARRRWLAPTLSASLAAAATASIFALALWGPVGSLGSTGVVPLTKTLPGEIAAAIDLGTGSQENTAGIGSAGAETGASSDVARQGSGYALADMTALWWGYPFGQRQRFIVPKFEDTAGKAAVYVVDGAPQYSAENATRIAAALGVEGTAVQEQGGWTVGSYETGIVSISMWGGTSVHYSNGRQDPFSACMQAAYLTGGDDYSAQEAECLAVTPAPTEAQARAAMSSFLVTLDIDEQTVSVSVDADAGVNWKAPGTLGVTASRVIDGKATPVTVAITVSSEGMLWGYGQIGEFVSLGDYGIVSPAEAAARLNGSAFSPELSAYGQNSSLAEPYFGHDPEQTEPPRMPQVGSAIPWALGEHQIVSARLGLSSIVLANGLTYVVPAYEFADSNGNRWSVLALAESALDLSAR